MYTQDIQLIQNMVYILHIYSICILIYFVYFYISAGKQMCIYAMKRFYQLKNMNLPVNNIKYNNKKMINYEMIKKKEFLELIFMCAL